MSEHVAREAAGQAHLVATAVAKPIIRAARRCGDDRGADAIEYLLDELYALAVDDAATTPISRRAV